MEALVTYSAKDEDFVVGRVVCATSWLVHDEILILDWNAYPFCRGERALIQITQVNVFNTISPSLARQKSIESKHMSILNTTQRCLSSRFIHCCHCRPLILHNVQHLTSIGKLLRLPHSRYHSSSCHHIVIFKHTNRNRVPCITHGCNWPKYKWLCKFVSSVWYPIVLNTTNDVNSSSLNLASTKSLRNCLICVNILLNEALFFEV